MILERSSWNLSGERVSRLNFWVLESGHVRRLFSHCLYDFYELYSPEDWVLKIFSTLCDYYSIEQMNHHLRRMRICNEVSFFLECDSI